MEAPKGKMDRNIRENLAQLAVLEEKLLVFSNKIEYDIALLRKEILNQTKRKDTHHDALFMDELRRKVGNIEIPATPLHFIPKQAKIQIIEDKSDSPFRDNIHLQKILLEMFKRVSAEQKFTKNFFNNDNWYLSYSWSAKEQTSFTDWICSYLIANSDAREKLMKTPSKKFEDVIRFANEFILTYGWALTKE